jgi:hypothetical protein
MEDNFFCRELSATLAEPLIGTAVPVNTWFLLEYTQPWYEKVTEEIQESQLPPAVQRWLAEQLARVENGRLQFIKQQPAVPTHPLHFYVASLHSHHSVVYRFQLPDYNALLEIDIDDLLTGQRRYEPYRYHKPLFFVCTHGKRDRCCALHGLLLYYGLDKVMGFDVWQTTHLGGHRFAPTLLSLPDGHVYGRLSPADVPHLLASQQEQHVLLDNLRGYSGYDTVTQIADHHLRHSLNQINWQALQHLHTTAIAPDRWQAVFRANGQTISVEVETADSLTLSASCSATKQKTIPQYRIRHP